MLSTVGRHAAALAICAIAVAWWLQPVLTRMSVAVPGAGAGDNVSFIWNVWWTRYALQHPGQSVFFTPLLFHPFGANLTQHTLTLLPALAVSWIDNPVLAQNILIVAHIFLNFASAYALAYRETRRVPPSLLAAVVFGWSPFVSAHLQGHFNLIAAWVLPLTALATLVACERPSWRSGAFVGILIGCIAYVDYYYVIYAVALTGLLLLHGALTVERVHAGWASWQRVVIRSLLGLLVCDGLIAVWILVTGGTELRVPVFRVSMHSLTNPLSAAWLLGLAWLCLYAIRVLRIRGHASKARERIPIAAGAAMAAGVVLVPLAIRALSLWHAGEYATQRYLWRSAPAGIDLATLVLGNPFNLFYGAAASRLYGTTGVDLVEQVAWLGPAVITFLAVVMLRCRPIAARWMLTTTVFGVWSLGPYLEVAGHGTACWLPATLLRWVPVVSNARIPGRAIAVVYLCCAIMCAHGCAWLLARDPPKRMFAAVLAFLVVLDFVPRRPAHYLMELPTVYRELTRDRSPGAVCELPMGVRDGLGELGRFDSRALYWQTFHQRPILGGFVARIPSSIRARYLAMPVIGSLLRLSSGAALTAEHPDEDRTQAATILASLGVRYVVVNASSCSPDLLSYVRRTLPLRLVSEEKGRALYVVDPLASSGR
jgi:hypothetical protein